MPSIRIDVRRSSAKAQEVALMDAAHAALVEAFGVGPTCPRTTSAAGSR